MARGHVATQIIALGVIFILMGIVSDSVYAVLAGSIGRRLSRDPAQIRRQRWFTGGLYILLGLSAAFMGSGRQK